MSGDLRAATANAQRKCAHWAFASATRLGIR